MSEDRLKLDEDSYKAYQHQVSDSWMWTEMTALMFGAVVGTIVGSVLTVIGLWMTDHLK